uniref:Uncharacterized protein n=1 Tax=viral metagenome TaxID=1070528 RepID=A0A6H1Z849_9ZZZZ
MANTSVIQALVNADLYKPSGRIPEQMLKTITPTGETREHRMSEIENADLQIFGNELDIALQLQNPLVQSLFAKNAVGLANLIRVVNTESSSGFKGTNGSGRQLDALLLRAEQFQDPDVALALGAGGERASWIRAIGAAHIAAAAPNFIEGDYGIATAHGSALPMGTTEGLAILGFANPAAAPCVDAVQLTYLAQQYNIQNLDFEVANPFIGDAICELKQPLFLYPQETALITVNYYQVGQDELRPIGIWVKMSTAMRTLLTS